MKNRDGVIGMFAVGLMSAALAAVVYTDAYSQTAKAEVQGVRALTDVASGKVLACADTSISVASATVQQ